MTDNPSKDVTPVSGGGLYQPGGTAGQPEKMDDGGISTDLNKSELMIHRQLMIHRRIVSGADDALNVQNTETGEGLVVAKELESKGVTQETGGKSSTMPSGGDSSQKQKPGLMSSSAAPSLPPFFKSSAPSSGMTCKDEVTQRPADETTTAVTVDGNKIEGVGFAGEATAVKAGCKCSLM